MGILIAGYLGAMYNKLGNAVGSNWKGINTVRTYAIPANPNTVAQQAQRTKFKAVSLFAKSLISTLVVTFWNPFAVKMSGYNALLKSVFPNASATGLITTSCAITKGSLESSSYESTPTYSTATGQVEISVDASISGNGLGSDFVGTLVIDKTDNSILGYQVGVNSREDSANTIPCTAGKLAANVLVFSFLYRGTGSDFVVSNSFSAQAVTA